MRICLINPYFNSHKPYCFKYEENGFTIPNLGIGYIAAILLANNYEVDIIETTHDNLTIKDVVTKILEGNYNAVGFSISEYNIFYFKRIMKRLNQNSSTAFTFAGGVYPTFNASTLLNEIDNLHCCVIGEGELVTLRLMQCLWKQENYRTIPGIAYRDLDTVVITGRGEVATELDLLPFPVRSYISEYGNVYLLTSRGCYNQCSFCLNIFKGTKLRYRSPENVIMEIEMLVKEHAVNKICFGDMNFSLIGKRRKKWIDNFCELIFSKDLHFNFNFEIRVDDIISGKEELTKLSHCGLEHLFIGIESFVQRQLDFYNKNTSVERNIQAIQILKNLKIAFDIGLVIFEPDVTLAEISESIRVCHELKLYENIFTSSPPLSSKIALIPFQGTKVSQMVINSKLYNPGKLLGYDFADPDIDYFYNRILNKWIDEVLAIHDLYYLIIEYDKKGDNENAHRLFEAKRDLFRIDVEFLYDLCCNFVKVKENSDVFLHLWKKQLEPIKKVFKNSL